MAHEIALKITKPLLLGSKDCEVIVRKKKRKLGTILVSQGGIEWMPSGNSKYAYSIQWEDFGKVMKDKGTRGRAKTCKKK